MRTLPTIIASLSLLASAAGFELKPGAAFPEIPLPTIAGGEPQSIADFRGQKLVLHVFASW